MLCDYADWIGLNTPEAHAQRAEQAAKMHARRDEISRDYDLIYGQFIADKYAGQFPTVEFTAFFRDPCQQAVSHYQFLLRHPELEHPWARKFHEVRPTLPEMIEAVPNFQSLYVGGVALDDFAMVAPMEQYERGVALFEALFDRKLPPEAARENVNPDRQGDAYPIGPAVRDAVRVHRAADVELYRRACERFDRLIARHGV